jgi:hypothetical protein
VFKRLRFDTEEGDGPASNDHDEETLHFPGRSLFLGRAQFGSVKVRDQRSSSGVADDETSRPSEPSNAY